MNVLEQWRGWQQRLPKRILKGRPIELEFLKEVLHVAPDKYSGTDRLYYYVPADKSFYTSIAHWDAGNMFANRTGEATALSAQEFAAVAGQKKDALAQNLPRQEQAELEKVFRAILDILLHS